MRKLMSRVEWGLRLDESLRVPVSARPRHMRRGEGAQGNCSPFQSEDKHLRVSASRLQAVWYEADAPETCLGGRHPKGDNPSGFQAVGRHGGELSRR